MRFVSFVLSLVLHVLVLGVTIYYPYRSKPINLKTMTYQVELVSLPKVRKKVLIKKERLAKRKSYSSKKMPVFLPKRITMKKALMLPKKVQEGRRKKGVFLPSKEKILEKVLAEVKKEVKKEEKLEKVLSKEISQLAKRVNSNVKFSKSSLDLEKEAYREAAKREIKKNWRLVPSKVFESLEAKVKLVIDKEGKILEWFFVKRSGNLRFDTSIIKAIEQTKKLPSPPFEVKFIIITFDAKELLL